MTPIDLMPSMQLILTLLQENELDAIDYILQSTNTEDVDIMVMLLRVTYPVRKNLQNWTELLRLARNNLLCNGLDSEVILKGLEEK